MGKMKWFASGICLSLFLGACTDSYDNGEVAIDDSSMDTISEDSEIWESEEGTATNDIGLDLIGEKVIRTINRDYETVDFEETHQTIMDKTNEYEGFVEYSSQSTDSYSDNTNRAYRYGYYTLRIPTESIDDFLASLDEMDALKINEDISTEDFTQHYTDTESRVNVLRNKEERLNTLLEQAESIEDIIQIETSLTETISERESLQSILDSYNSLIDYTSVHIGLSERQRISGERGESIPFLERAKEAIVDSLFAFYYTAQNLIIGLIYALPFIIGIGLIIGIIYYINKKRNKPD